MRSTYIASTPGALEKPLDAHLNRHVAPSTSRVPPIYRETTICYSYMCPYAYGCAEKTKRPAQVMMRRCIRYMPDDMRIEPGVSDLALDLLAKRRQGGEQLSKETTAILDQYRADGPMRKSI